MRIITIVLLFFLCSCNDDNKQIDFNTSAISEIQDATIGKWKIFQQCAGIGGCVDVTDYYTIIEKGTVTYEIGNQTVKHIIVEWEKKQNGCVLIGEDQNEILRFETLKNDTLIYSIMESGIASMAGKKQ